MDRGTPGAKDARCSPKKKLEDANCAQQLARMRFHSSIFNLTRHQVFYWRLGVLGVLGVRILVTDTLK